MRAKRYSSEFKAEAVRLVLEQGLAPAQAARDLGVSQTSMDKWIRQARLSRPSDEPIAISEREELKLLRKEVSALKLEREILKKAAAYFAKTSI
jgi:transposase